MFSLFLLFFFAVAAMTKQEAIVNKKNKRMDERGTETVSRGKVLGKLI